MTDFVVVPAQTYRKMRQTIIAMEALEDTWQPYVRMTFQEVVDWQDEFYTRLEIARLEGEDV